MSNLHMKYFVLKPRGGDEYAEASRQAMYAYADYIEVSDPEFARSIKTWVDEEVTRYVLSGDES
jgi:hypothetical protein